jgi:hypothetical protein
MGLNSALVDSARIARREAAGVKVEGRTRFGTVIGPWFRCRLELASRPQNREGESEVPRVVEQSTMLFGVKDTEGRVISLLATDKVQVLSPQLGVFHFEVAADPTPLRKKRRVIGWEVGLRAINEQEFDPTGALAAGVG